MKTPNRINQVILTRRAGKESGLSLVETLIAIALFAVLAVMAVTLIVSTMQTTARFSEVSTTQAQVNQAASVIQRDITLADSVSYASPSQLTFTTRQSNKDYEVSIFAWNPASTDTLPAHVDKSKLPAYSALIENRFEEATGKSAATVLVKGYDPNGYLGKTLFSFYDSDNDEVKMDSATQKDYDSISRVEYRIAANAAGRASKIQIESSATLNYSLPPGVAANNISGTPDCPANIVVSIVPRETRSTVRWNAPAGSTSYTLYRYNYTNGNALEKSIVIANPDTTSYVDDGLAWGTTYSYALQSAGPAGTSTICNAGNTATVVPDVTKFVNVNSVQPALAAVKSGSGAENLTGPTVAGYAKTVATTNISSGKKYTVARGLTNQVAWNDSFGTTRFNVYRNGNQTTPVATLASGTFVWQDTNNAYGDTDTYIIKAANAGGESFSSDPITLISPPTASTFSASRPDTSTRASTTDNVINLTKSAANTTGYKVNRVTTTASSANCDLAGRQSAFDFLVSEKTTTDNSIEWGSYSCYNMVGFNDAGDGVPSSDLVVKQFPGKFNITALTATQYQWIDSNVALPSGAQCWVTNTGSTREPCNAYAPRTSSNRFAVGLFGSVSNKKTDINIVWNESDNAYGDYTVSKNRTATAGIVDQGANCNSSSPSGQCVTTGGAPYVSGRQSVKFQNEMPGSAYTFNVVAKAANGETRNSSSTASTVTSPDIPKSLDNGFQTRSTANPNYQRVKAYADTSVRRGLVSQVGIVAISTTGKNEQRFNDGSGVQTVYSPEFPYGNHSEYAYSYLNLNGKETYSATIGRNGSVTPGCSYACGSSFGDLPESYPLYYAGAHYRYNSGGSAASSVVSAGNNDALDSPAKPVAPQDDGNTSDGATYNCSVIPENDPGFINEYGCSYGQGIPTTPTGLAATRSNDVVTVSWNPVANVSGYKVVVTTNGSSKTIVVNGTTTTTFNIAASTTSTIIVRSYNANNDSPDSSPVSVSRPADPITAPTNLRVASQSGTTANIAWDAVTGATGYKITASTDGGATNVFTTTATTYALNTPYGTSTVVSVQALRNSEISPASNQLTINVDLAAPAAPANFASYNAATTAISPNAIQWSAVTCATGTAQYRLTTTAPTSAVVMDWGTNTSVTNLNHTADTSYTYSVVSRCVDGSKLSAASPASNTTFTARYNTTAAPSTAPTVTQSDPYIAGQTVSGTFPATTCPAGTTTTYKLYRNGSLVTSTTSTNWSTTNPGTAGNYTYTYTVSCTSNGYTTAESPASPGVTTAVYTRPDAPSNFTVQRIYGKNVTLAWTGVPAASSYKVTLNGVTKTVSNTSNSTITTVMTDGVRNTSFKSGAASVQPDPDPYDTATIQSITASGITSSTNSTVNVDMPQARQFQGKGHNMTSNGTKDGSGIDTRNQNSMVSASGDRATVVQSDGNLVTYNITTSTGTPTYSSRRTDIKIVVLNSNGAMALYKNDGSGNVLLACPWGCGDTTMIAQENAANGTSGGFLNGYTWNGSGFANKGAFDTSGQLG
jgi:type II secretory pathway pseudopilin PulG